MASRALSLLASVSLATLAVKLLQPLEVPQDRIICPLLTAPTRERRDDRLAADPDLLRGLGPTFVGTAAKVVQRVADRHEREGSTRRIWPCSRDGGRFLAGDAHDGLKLVVAVDVRTVDDRAQAQSD